MKIVNIGILGIALLLMLLNCSSMHYAMTSIISNSYPEALFHIRTNEYFVALTIDDSPDSVTTSAIMEVLSKYDAKATFFLITDYIAGNENIVTQMIENEHEIGSGGD